MSVAPDDLLDHLTALSRLSRPEAERLVAEVLAYYAETVEVFIERRHAELKREGLRNPEVWERLRVELEARRFAVSARSERV